MIIRRMRDMCHPTCHSIHSLLLVSHMAANGFRHAVLFNSRFGKLVSLVIPVAVTGSQWHTVAQAQPANIVL